MKGLVLAALAVLTLSIATAAAFAENNGGGNAYGRNFSSHYEH